MKLLALLVFALTLTGAAADITEKYAATAREKWEDDIAAFEALDRNETYPKDSILFVGSSSIRMWSTIAEDMAPFPVIQRGYGGAKFQDLAVYAKRIIHPHEFRALVLFVGNDISGSDQDIAPEEVGKLFAHVVATVREKDADVPVFLVAVTPTPSRWDAWPQVARANAAMEAVCNEQENLYYIDTVPHVLGDDGKPKGELFRDDDLHLNDEGYKLWSGLIRDRIKAVLEK